MSWAASKTETSSKLQNPLAAHLLYQFQHQELFEGNFGFQQASSSGSVYPAVWVDSNFVYRRCFEPSWKGMEYKNWSSTRQPCSCRKNPANHKHGTSSRFLLRMVYRRNALDHPMDLFMDLFSWVATMGKFRLTLLQAWSTSCAFAFMTRTSFFFEGQIWTPPAAGTSHMDVSTVAVWCHVGKTGPDPSPTCRKAGLRRQKKSWKYCVKRSALAEALFSKQFDIPQKLLFTGQVLMYEQLDRAKSLWYHGNPSYALTTTRNLDWIRSVNLVLNAG